MSDLEPWKVHGDWPQAAIYDLAIDRCIEVVQKIERDSWPDRIEPGAITPHLRELKITKQKG